MCLWLYILQIDPSGSEVQYLENIFFQIVVQSLSHIWLCDPMNCIMPDISVIPSLCPWLCSNSCSLSQWYQPTISSSVVPFSSCPQSFLELGPLQRVSSFHRWPKYWSFSFSISPCNEYSGLISFRIDWLDLFAVQGTLKSLLQHHSSKDVGSFFSAQFLYSSALTFIHGY